MEGKKYRFRHALCDFCGDYKGKRFEPLNQLVYCKTCILPNQKSKTINIRKLEWSALKILSQLFHLLKSQKTKFQLRMESVGYYSLELQRLLSEKLKILYLIEQIIKDGKVVGQIFKKVKAMHNSRLELIMTLNNRGDVFEPQLLDFRLEISFQLQQQYKESRKIIKKLRILQGNCNKISKQTGDLILTGKTKIKIKFKITDYDLLEYQIICIQSARSLIYVFTQTDILIFDPSKPKELAYTICFQEMYIQGCLNVVYNKWHKNLICLT
ncbi:UNKNOWN [Stylonychia lemnae]|uniref:Uncharacterized protein n=1 Tax=Stylonychia lemnae TaxID=5949 RepID=A0A077ZV24_STYLE|nr:UNKNOWN [Stylonychia lemnae]|eukprot:CDW73150.1 UNKNOWN [Stylonychia lemnae]